jgi:N-acetyl-anhydromuramyl-L-alanine amidase AmpD
LVDIIKYGEFKSLGKQKKKHQIILSHTSRNVENYLQSLKYRYSGKYPKIPNYVITKEGKILKLLSNTEHTNFLNESDINRSSIVIVLENLGWLQKEPLKDYYVNWIGDIYKGNVFEKKWRDYYFWQPYTSIQVENTSILCSKLLKEMKIKNQVIGHNTKINGIERYDGIVSKSNFDTDYTDVSPAFNFEEFLKKIEHEQFT